MQVLGDRLVTLVIDSSGNFVFPDRDGRCIFRKYTDNGRNDNSSNLRVGRTAAGYYRSCMSVVETLKTPSVRRDYQVGLAPVDKDKGTFAIGLTNEFIRLRRMVRLPAQLRPYFEALVHGSA